MALRLTWDYTYWNINIFIMIRLVKYLEIIYQKSYERMFNPIAYGYFSHAFNQFSKNIISTVFVTIRWGSLCGD